MSSAVSSIKRGVSTRLPPSVVFETQGKRGDRRASDHGVLPDLMPLDELRPTQMAVGMRAVGAKRRKIERIADSRRKLRNFLEKRPVPAVLGPKARPYIIDHHHLSLALWQSDVDEVFVSVVADLSDLPKRAFLSAMAARGWLHAYDGSGRKACPTRLPKAIHQLRPDPYRDLAWAVREAGGFEKTNAPFIEFRWANFFRDRIPEAMLSRDFDRAHKRAMRMARSGEARHLPGSLSGFWDHGPGAPSQQISHN